MDPFVKGRRKESKIISFQKLCNKKVKISQHTGRYSMLCTWWKIKMIPSQVHVCLWTANDNTSYFFHNMPEWKLTLSHKTN